MHADHGDTPAGASDDGLEACVEEALTRLGYRLVMALPLGLGKPNELVNAFYRRARRDPRIRLEICTALSLDPPDAGSGLQARFVEPFVKRHFGADYPRLEYAADLAARRLPDNVRVSEFYLQSGSLLGNADAQRAHVSTNYTHVARDLIDRGVNLAMQLVAADPEGGSRYSLACNPDVTLDLKQRLEQRPSHRCMLVGQVHPELPYMHGDAVVEADFFDRIVSPSAGFRLFGLPRTPVSVQDHWVGLHASRLVADGGTLQIGIGSLSDAVVHALLLRHGDNAAWRAVLPDGDEGSRLQARLGGGEPFSEGLYGASEMFMDAFMHLYRAGILRRGVFDDEALQRAANDGALPEAERGGGALMDAAFFLGSQEFYQFLRELDGAERPRFRMGSVGRVNQLYGGDESLEKLQRRRARFINTCMMVTATGAAVSDGLKDHQVVSGVGGQYNFVAMAHAMDDGRSVLMLRSTRGSGRNASSSIVWEYPHTTVPRHLRDLVVTEYGVADLRGRSDEECIQALLSICDARFQPQLAAQAVRAGKLSADWQPPARARANTPERLRERLHANGGERLFPSYPFGSDFTEVEQRLVPALKRLRGLKGRPLRLAGAVLRGRPRRYPEEMERMDLSRPDGVRERLYARLLAAALDD